MKRLIFIDGQPQSGKTALAWSIAQAYERGWPWERQSATVAEPKDFFYDQKTKVYSFDESKMNEAVTQCKVRVKAAMKRGDAVILIPHKFDSGSQKKDFMFMAKHFGYEIQNVFTTQPRSI